MVDVSKRIVYWLSQYRARLYPRSKLISRKILDHYMSSILAEEAATSSTSVIDFITHLYSVAFQSIGPPNR